MWKQDSENRSTAADDLAAISALNSYADRMMRSIAEQPGSISNLPVGLQGMTLQQLGAIDATSFTMPRNPLVDLVGSDLVSDMAGSTATTTARDKALSIFPADRLGRLMMGDMLKSPVQPPATQQAFAPLNKANSTSDSKATTDEGSPDKAPADGSGDSKGKEEKNKIPPFPKGDPDVGDIVAWLYSLTGIKTERPGLDASFDDILKYAKAELVKKGVKYAKKKIEELLADGLASLLKDKDSLIASVVGAGGDAGLLDGALKKIEELYDKGMEYLSSPEKLAVLGIEQGLKFGVDHLFENMWKPDDNSSALEVVAHALAKAIVKNIVDTLLSDVKTLEDLAKNFKNLYETMLKKIDEFIFGKSMEGVPNMSGAGGYFPAATLGHSDDKVDTIATGAATVTIEGMLAARIGDILVPSAKPILTGADKVFVSGFPLSRATEKTAVPSLVKTGAATVLVGGASVNGPSPKMTPAPPPSVSDSAAGAGGAGNGKGANGSPGKGNEPSSGKGENGDPSKPADDATKSDATQSKDQPPASSEAAPPGGSPEGGDPKNPSSNDSTTSNSDDPNQPPKKAPDDLGVPDAAESSTKKLEELEQKKADELNKAAQQDYEKAKSDAAKLQQDAVDKQANADALQKNASELSHSATSSSDVNEASKAHEAASKAQFEADQAKAIAKAGADIEPPTKFEVPSGLKTIGKVANGLGVAGDVVQGGVGIYTASQQAANGEDRSAIVTATSTIGNLGGGAVGAASGAIVGAAFGGPIGAVVGAFIGAFATGNLGEEAGKIVGEDLADKYGIRDNPIRKP
jgi:uncharacterized Zn-binding protein involved in type VI secretion